MKCPTCGGTREIKEHAIGAKVSAFFLHCPTCLTGREIPQPSREDVLAYRAEVANQLRHMGMDR